MTSRRARARTRDIVIVGVLLLGLVAGVVLVVTGGGSDDGSAADPEGLAATIPFDEVSMAEIEDWAGLDVPGSAGGFLTARVGDGQLDVTFTMASDDESVFVDGSGLPEPVAGDRQVLHSSPLWRLNPGTEPDGAPSTPDTTVLAEDPDPDAEVVADVAVRAMADTHEGIGRAVELVDEGADTVRARIVLTAR